MYKDITFFYISLSAKRCCCLYSYPRCYRIKDRLCYTSAPQKKLKSKIY